MRRDGISTRGGAGGWPLLALIALLLTAGVLPAQEWSGTITVVESVVGPGASGPGVFWSRYKPIGQR